MKQDLENRREMSLMTKLALPEQSEPPWGFLGALLTVGVLFLCLTLIGPTSVSAVMASTGNTRDVLFPFELMISWVIGMALAVVFVLVSRRSSEESWQALSLTRGELALPLALLVGIAIALAVDLAVSLASGGFWPAPQIWGFQRRGLSGLLLAGLSLIVLQPLAETLVFQGVLLPRMRWTFGHWGGVIGTAGVYTVLYQLVFIEAYQFYDQLWHGIVFPMSIAILFCLLKVYTRSTGAALIARMGAGLIFLLTAVAISGG